MSQTNPRTSSVLVTGASRGIGLATAKLLASRMHHELHLALSARDGEVLKAAEEQVREVARLPDQLRTHTVVMDVSDPAAVQDGMLRVHETCGALTGLVLNAGVAESAPLHQTSDAMFERVMSINVGGVFRVMRAGLREMVEQKYGRVVVVGSIASKIGAPYISTYCASKHAVLGMVKAAALEYAAKGITVNAVCPGYVDTPMTERSLQNISEKTGLSTANALQKILASTPQRRLFTADEIAEGIVFLLSDAAAGINGSTLDIDGGEMAG